MEWIKNEVKTVLINAKLHKIIGVINLDQIKSWDLIRCESKWVSAVLIDSKYPLIADHFTFSFKTKNTYNLLNFTFTLLDGKRNPIKFKST